MNDIKKINLIISVITNIVSTVSAETVEYIAYGNMDSWITRNIKESKILGGNLKFMPLVLKKL